MRDITMHKNDNVLTEVRELAEVIIDDLATERDIRRLEQLIRENDEAGKAYVMCMDIDVGLHLLFGGKSRRSSKARSFKAAA